MLRLCVEKTCKIGPCYNIGIAYLVKITKDKIMEKEYIICKKEDYLSVLNDLQTHDQENIRSIKAIINYEDEPLHTACTASALHAVFVRNHCPICAAALPGWHL